MYNRIFIIMVMCWVGLMNLPAQIVIHEINTSLQDFPLVDGKPASIIVDDNDDELIKISATLFAEDIQRVTNKKIKVRSLTKRLPSVSVVIGTIGKNRIIDNLIAEKKIDVSAIRNGWEQYIIHNLKNPIEGVEDLLVIAGCDRRGTAYGVFSMSEAMGVSPLYWWADVPVVKRKNVIVEAINYSSKKPSVKYRGIFINDEGWGFRPWASETFEPEVGNAGPRTYAKVFELILRMKGNMLAPAMHPKTTSFHLIPENRMTADKYGIVMTASHCEPLLYNNTTEWDEAINGKWNYIENKEGINNVLEKRVSETAPYENAYVLAMRGIHDAGLVGVPDDRKVEVTETALNDQRALLKKYINKPIEYIPQVFVPYKEVLDIYEQGLNLPDDVTLVWPDDNYGYIKRLNNINERNRKGGSGVYYHISYLGEPHDYLWLNTTPPALIYEEMKKAYDTGANRYWLLNVGDIKPGELGMKYFLDMAWNIEQANFDKAHTFDADYLAGIFGQQYKADLQDIFSSYYLLGFQHKPEGMGWGFEWNYGNGKEQLLDTDFSFVNYNEAENRMREYDRIADKSERIMSALPEKYKAAFFELVFYPVKGASLMNKKMLTAQRNRWYAKQGRASTDYYADLAKSYHDSIQTYTKQYNEMLDGKWNKMMSLAPGWTATYQNMPPVSTTELIVGEDMQIFLPGQDTEWGVNHIHTLPCLNPFLKKNTFIELYNRGNKAFKWVANTNCNWIKLSKQEGVTELQDRIWVSIDWDKAPYGNRIVGEIEILTQDKTEKIYLPVFNPENIKRDQLKGLYVEDNGCVSINAGVFHRKKENKDIKIRSIKNLGYEGDAVQLGAAVKPSQRNMGINRTPQVEYDFYTFNSGTVTVHIYALPLFPIDSKSDTRYGVMIDDGLLQWMTTNSKEYSSQWKINVARNSAVSTINLNIKNPGKHTLKLLCGDAGMVVQKIVLDFGGMKRSYLGPRSTMVE